MTEKSKAILGVVLLIPLFVTNGLAAPTPEVLVTDVISSHIAVQDDYLIWSEYSPIPIRKMPKNGGPITNLAHIMGAALNLTIYNGHIFWIERWGDTRILNKTSIDGITNSVLATGKNYVFDAPKEYADILMTEDSIYWVTFSIHFSINKVPMEGGDSTVLMTTSAPIRSLIRDDFNLYWVEWINNSYDNGFIKKMPLEGGTPITIYSPDQSMVYGPIASHNGQILFGEIDRVQNQWRLMNVSSSGGEPSVMATLPEPNPGVWPNRIVVDANKVYWILGRSINAIPLNSGEPTILMDDLSLPEDIVVVDGNIYWAEKQSSYGSGGIKKMPTDGGPVTVLAENLDLPSHLFMDGFDLYWSESFPNSTFREEDGRIVRMSQDGGNVQTVVSGVSDVMPHYKSVLGTVPFVTDNANVYFVDGSVVKTVPLSGGTVERLAYCPFRAEVKGIATDGEFVYYSCAGFMWKVPIYGGEALALASDYFFEDGPIRIVGDIVYWANDDFTIKKVHKTGGEITTISSTLPFMSDFVVDEDNIFFSGQDTGEISRISVNGGPITNLSGGLRWSWNILALDQNNVYWIDQLDIGKVPKIGGNTTYILGGLQTYLDFPSAIVVDQDNLYWTETGGGTIKKMNLAPLGPMSIVFPKGGETLTAGSTQTIRWNYTGNPGSHVKIELLKGGVLNRTIKSFALKGTGGSGSYNWTIPADQAPGTDYRIRVTSTSNGAYTDTSDSDFTIAAPTITVVSPNGAETWTAGLTQTIRWSYTGNPGSHVKIELLKGGVVNRIIRSFVSKGSGGNGSFNWPIPSTQEPGSDYQIRVTSTSNNSYSDTSDSNFTISK